MSTVHEIETAIRGLGPHELADSRAWFVALDAENWDRKMEQDIAEGRLDHFADEALSDLEGGRCTDL